MPDMMPGDEPEAFSPFVYMNSRRAKRGYTERPMSDREREVFEAIDKETSTDGSKERIKLEGLAKTDAWLKDQIAQTERRLSILHKAAKLSGQLQQILGDLNE